MVMAPPVAVALAVPQDSRVLFTALVLLVVLERLVELLISRRNTKRALDDGAIEAGSGHYPVMVLLHASFLPLMVAEVWLLERVAHAAIWPTALLLLAGTMALRYWVIATLGDRWSTRVVVRPHDHAVHRGPFRFLRHPNYLAVLLETAALPLVHGAWLTALVFVPLNAALLRHRIGVEEAALARFTDWGAHLG